MEEQESGKLITVDPSHLRKYFREYILIGLASAVVFLFFALRDLNMFIIKNLTEQKVELIKTTQAATSTQQELIRVIDRNTQAILELRNSKR